MRETFAAEEARGHENFGCMMKMLRRDAISCHARGAGAEVLREADGGSARGSNVCICEVDKRGHATVPSMDGKCSSTAILSLETARGMRSDGDRTRKTGAKLTLMKKELCVHIECQKISASLPARHSALEQTLQVVFVANKLGVWMPISTHACKCILA